VLVVIAWVAVNAARNDSDSSRLLYSQLISVVEVNPQNVERVLFSPHDHGLEVRFRDGRTIETHYPGDAAQFALQRVLEREGIAFDAEGSGESPWWGLLAALLPFVILVAFWAFLMQRMRSGRDVQEPVVAELRELRRALERRP
jgi:ATP-dependent Zn protease